MNTPVRTDTDNLAGVFAVRKPVGMTAHDLVQRVKRATGYTRAGHTANLDIRASGVMVVLVGPAVRLSELLLDEKEYQVTVKFTKTTRLTQTAFETYLNSHLGSHNVEGYGASSEDKHVFISHLELLEWDDELDNQVSATFKMVCTSASYTRPMIALFGQQFDSSAELERLSRTKSNGFSLREASTLEELETAGRTKQWYKLLKPAAQVLTHLPTEILTDEDIKLLKNGHKIRVSDHFAQAHVNRICSSKNDPDVKGKLIQITNPAGELIALVRLERLDEHCVICPHKVLIPN